MAIINFTGFEHGHPATLVAAGDNYVTAGTLARGSISTTTFHAGTRAFRVEDLGGAFAGCYYEYRTPARAALGWSSGTRYVNFWWYPATQAGSNPIVCDIGGKIQMVWLSGTDTIRIEGSTTSSTTTVTQDAWNLITITYVNGSTSTLQVNGGTGVTATAHGGTADYVILGSLNGNIFQGDMYFDDLILSDTALTYDPFVYALRPDGNGSATGWTGAFGDVDEIAADNDTTFISTSSAATKEAVTLESTTTAGVVGAIKSVKSLAIVRDEGGVASIETYIRPVSTDREGNENVDPGTTYVGIGTVWDTNPDTAAAWAASELDATELGVQNINAVAVRCTQLALMVLTDGVAAASDPEPSLIGGKLVGNSVLLKHMVGTGRGG